MKSHFHFPIILESVTSQMLLQCAKLYYNLLCLSSELVHIPHHLLRVYFQHNRIFKLVPSWDKCINMLGGYVEK
jgi:hypothetical protein